MDRKLILLIEDDFDLRETLSSLLQSEGYLTETAANGKEALDYLISNAHPHLILVDNNMPVMDGIEFLAQKNQKTEIASIPVIAVSAMIEPMKGLKGLVAHVAKPIDLDELLKLIKIHSHGFHHLAYVVKD